MDNLDDHGLWVDTRPATEPVRGRIVLIHGVLDRGASFNRTARRLENHEVIRYDRRGYNRSIGAAPATDPQRHAADVLRLLDGRPAALVGHSYGGVVALIAAAHEPDLVTAVGAYEPPTPWSPSWPSPRDEGRRSEPAARAEQFLRSMIGDAVWERLPEQTRELRRREGVALAADLEGLGNVMPFDHRAIVAPVLLGYGSEAADRHRLGAIELAEILRAPAPVVLDGAAHGAHLSHPDAFARFVEAVVDQVQH